MPHEKIIHVLIVDDHPSVRRGLSVFLEAWDDLACAGEAENGVEALQKVEELQPDVVLMDLIMPEMDGITATRMIRENYPQTQVVVLTSAVDDELIHQALQAGAYTYMVKNVSIDTMA
jgi:two-component system, NarL family, response regulator LiaR